MLRCVDDMITFYFLSDFIDFDMVGQQFTDEQKNWIYTKNVSLNNCYGSYGLLRAAFQAKFPGVNPPIAKTFRNIRDKQNTHFTVKNLNSKTYPGPTQSGRLSLSAVPQLSLSFLSVVTQ